MASYQATVLQDNPIIFLRFSETAGANCADSGTNGLTGTAQGGFTRNVATGFAGTTPGITCNGTTGYVNVPDNNLLDLTGDATYECWYNLAAIPTDGYLMSKGRQSAGNAGYGIQILTGGTLRWVLTEFGALATSTYTVTTGAWHHLVVTWHSSDSAYVFYVDGTSHDSGTGGVLAPVNTTRPFTMMAADTDGTVGTFVNGSIDEVAVYGSVLSAARVAAHYAARNTATDSNPGKQTSPGQLVSAIVQARNEERKAARGEPRFPQRRPSGYPIKKERD